MLAEVDAKRRTIDEHAPHRRPDGELECRTCSYTGDEHAEWPCLTMRLLALPYADDPDYRQGWAL